MTVLLLQLYSKQYIRHNLAHISDVLKFNPLLQRSDETILDEDAIVIVFGEIFGGLYKCIQSLTVEYHMAVLPLVEANFDHFPQS